MKILFAAPDRDLLECYKKLFEDDLGQSVTAFDGTQVITLLSTENFDLLILDRKIPRVDYHVIIERANSSRIPVVLLTDEPAGVRHQAENGSLAYPFTFERIKGAVKDALEKNRSIERVETVSEDE